MKSVKTILVTLSLVSVAFVSDGFADPPELKGKEQLKNPKQGQWNADREHRKEYQKCRDEWRREQQKDRG